MFSQLGTYLRLTYSRLFFLLFPLRSSQTFSFPSRFPSEGIAWMLVGNSRRSSPALSDQGLRTSYSDTSGQASDCLVSCRDDTHTPLGERLDFQSRTVSSFCSPFRSPSCLVLVATPSNRIPLPDKGVSYLGSEYCGGLVCSPYERLLHTLLSLPFEKLLKFSLRSHICNNHSLFPFYTLYTPRGHRG